MKLETLEKVVLKHADKLHEDAGYSGSHNDGGARDLRITLEQYKHKLLVKNDLRPSELTTDYEVGEPTQFKDIIDARKEQIVREKIESQGINLDDY